MHYSLLLCLLVWAQCSFANTLRGTVLDESGNTLPFVSIYLKGTSIGTTSNVDGIYSLPLEPGDYQIVFQYVGFEAKTLDIKMTSSPQEQDVVLKPISTNLQEVVVTAGEDPAYRIIRKAIKRRPFYRKEVPQYSCNAYVKGTQYIKNLPESFLGQSLEDFRQGLDSTGTGIIYLSESLSDLHYNKGEYKEIMTSSKISGDDNGFSFNSGAGMAELSFYENSIELGDTKLLSPIGSGALGVYKYRLETSFFDDNGNLIYKIEVLPKNPLGAVFAGYIYIADKDWAIHSTELFTTGKSANISILDTVYFRQTHVKIEQKTWRLFSQDIQFSLNLLFIGTQGRFVGIFKNYELNPTFERNFFNAEVFRVEESANKKLDMHWDSIRPVQLTQDESKEYREKDSLQKIWKSDAYLDSIDRLANRPQLLDLLTGYTYQNSKKNYSWTIFSPIYNLHFNTVQGQIIGLGGAFRKELNPEKYQWMRLQTDLEYSLADRQFRGRGIAQFRFNAITNSYLQLEGGRYKQQFNRRNPIPELVNTYYSLLGRLNYMKIYDDYYGRLYYSQELFNGVSLRTALRYGYRVPLVNNSDVSWTWLTNPPNDYTSNQPLDIGNPIFPNEPSFEAHQYLEFAVALRLRFKQTYISYPNRRFYAASDLPDLWIRYRRGIPLLGGVTNYDYLEVAVEKEDLAIGTVGLLSFKATAGYFLSRQNIPFMDFYHFNGNQTAFAKSDAYLSTFQLLPYYTYSTNTGFAMLHVQHDFNGFLWNKIPGLKVLGFEFVAGYHLLYNLDQPPYMEFNLGLDRIGWSLFRILRVDAVLSYQSQWGWQVGGVLSLNISL